MSWKMWPLVVGGADFSATGPMRTLYFNGIPSNPQIEANCGRPRQIRL